MTCAPSSPKSENGVRVEPSDKRQPGAFQTHRRRNGDERMAFWIRWCGYQIMHLAYLSLQCFDLFQLAASTFQISDEEMLEMYYRIGDAMGIERMRWD
jgi:hypothetical protein